MTMEQFFSISQFFPLTSLTTQLLPKFQLCCQLSPSQRPPFKWPARLVPAVLLCKEPSIENNYRDV